MIGPAARIGRRPTGNLNPAKVVALAFALAVAVGTALLSLPIATTQAGSGPFVDALFTATSAVCVTGLVTVDTGTHWTGFGQGVILALIQAGGLGIMTVASLFVVLISRRLGLRGRLIAQAQTRAVSMEDVRRVVRNVVIFSFTVELVVAVALSLRFGMTSHRDWLDAIYNGIFHSVSAFNNAGFSTHSDSLMRYVDDPYVLVPVALAVILGGLGFPVVFELLRAWRRPSTWTVLTRITLGVSVALLVVGTVFFLLAEFDNPRTLGSQSTPTKLVASFFTATMPRSSGFNAIDTAGMQPESWLMTDILMFIGGGSAGTAGGIKVTTFGLLLFVIWAEIRGEREVRVGNRSVPLSNQREALTVALLGVGLAGFATLVLLTMTHFPLDQVIFETISALCTVGLSTGITFDLSDPAKVFVTVLMFVGRLGPLTLATALALRSYQRRYSLPEERMIVG